MTLPKLEDFPSRTFDKLRFGDTDRQGHVNNAVFVTFLESGRIAAMSEGEDRLRAAGTVVVVARIELDYRRELFWPGTVEIGTAVTAVGRSSVTFTQALYQHGECVATAVSVIVQVDATTHRPMMIAADVKEALLAMALR